MMTMKNPNSIKIFGVDMAPKYQKFRLFGVDNFIPLPVQATVAIPLRICLPNQPPVPFIDFAQKNLSPAPINHHHQSLRLFGVNLNTVNMVTCAPNRAPSIAANPENHSKKKHKSITPDAAGTGSRKKSIISRKWRNTDQEENLKVPEVIPSGFTEFIRTKQDFLCRKKLTATDISMTATRVFVISSSKAEIFNRFLTEPAEVERLHTMIGIPVSVMNPKGKFYEMDLALWPSVGQVVLKKRWTPFVKMNELKAGDVLEFWGCRKDGRFCLAIEIVRKQAEVLNIDLSLPLNIQ